MLWITTIPALVCGLAAAILPPHSRLSPLCQV
jgi:hypothetical protein